MVGWCLCPRISYITSDFIFPLSHNHLSLSVSVWPPVWIHPGFKYRFQQDYLKTHTHTHTHTSSSASQHTLSPHFNPKSPRGQSKSSRSQSYDAGASVVSNSSHWLRITLADREGDCLWWGRLLRVRYGWLNYPSPHTHKHTYCVNTHMLTLPHSALHFTEDSVLSFCPIRIIPIYYNLGLILICLASIITLNKLNGWDVVTWQHWQSQQVL